MIQLSRELLGIIAVVYVREFLGKPLEYFILQFLTSNEDVQFLLDQDFLRLARTPSFNNYQCIVTTSKGERAVEATSYLGLAMACVDVGCWAIAVDMFKYLHSSELCVFLVSEVEYLRQWSLTVLTARGL